MGLVRKSVPLIKAANSHTLADDERLMDLLSTYHAIALDEDDDYSAKLTWCLEHCQNKFRDIRHTKSRVWYFQNEHDATMFAMRWA